MKIVRLKKCINIVQLSAFLLLVGMTGTANAHGSDSRNNLEEPKSKVIISGKVINEYGEEMSGAYVLEKDEVNGTITDVDGMFSIEVNEGATLVVSYVGYLTQDVFPDGRTKLEIILEEGMQSPDGDDEVAVAFGRIRRDAFTGAAGVVKSDDLGRTLVNNPLNALAGRVSGVQLTHSSSQPGSTPSVNIRGYGSISSGTEPLIVVDGTPFDGDLNLINAGDIESMTVLKDAASGALYGLRGANGVIMITTKRGTGGDARVTFDSKWGYNFKGVRNYETVNSRQFYETYYKMLYNDRFYGENSSRDEAWINADKYLPGEIGYIVYTPPEGERLMRDYGAVHPDATLGAIHPGGDEGQKFWLQPDDWEKEASQNGFRQEYSLSVSGASNRIS
ncbi:MAG: TonB-dependent receptor plug domain-containing protein, partial [Proteiniphilum sp.]|nr:TonB-dependent receptor plug domain-containing protein [Proteiniphilum sp.]